MALTTNIVLDGNQGRTQSYTIQLIPEMSGTGEFVFNKNIMGHAILYDNAPEKYWIKDGNDWIEEMISGTGHLLHKSTIRIYFPQYSVDTFDRGTTYILSLITHIHGVEVDLGEFIIKRKDALACVPIRFSGMEEYYEYIDLSIVDPYELHFGEAAKSIRESLGELEGTSDNSSLLYIGLYAVEKGENGYILRNDWGSGQNSLFLNNSDELKLQLSYLVEEHSVGLDLNYNTTYGGDISKYFRETYNTDDVSILWQYVVMDNDNIYHESSHTTALINNCNFDITPVDEFFKSWDNWRFGLNLRATATFFKSNLSPEYSFMSVFSNTLPLTQSLFAKMVLTDGYNDLPFKIDLSSIDMNNININAINKIIQNVTVVTPTDSTKNHLIQPVFYQTRELNKVVIHPSVTENIAINLDTYKPQVDRFKIQIEGIVFNEIGRTSKGIIFKIYGSMLPKDTDSGTMYVLDQNNDLVTTGKYSYVY